MRKLILFFLFVFSVTVGFAQSFSGDKLFISVDGGKGVLFGKSNLSPFGVNYRGEYNGGLTCNVKTLYRIDKFWVAGLKFNLSGTSANYTLDDKTNVADNVELWTATWIQNSNNQKNFNQLRIGSRISTLSE